LATLDDRTLEVLFELDEYRRRAKDFRSQARGALKQLRPVTKADRENIEFLVLGEKWSSSKSDVEVALLAKVQGHRDMGEPEDEAGAALTKRLESIDLAVLSPRSAEDNPFDPVPVLVAARGMHALVGRSNTVFCKASLLCYYRIIRELYTAHDREWIVGAARAGKASHASAFVTSECIRAVLAFEKSLRDTARFFETTKSLYEECERITALPDLVEIDKEFSKAKNIEFERLGLDWFASNNLRRTVISYDLSDENGKALFDLEGKITPEFITTTLKKLPLLLLAATRKAMEQVKAAKDELEAAREEEAGLLTTADIIDIKVLAQKLDFYTSRVKVEEAVGNETADQRLAAMITINLVAALSTETRTLINFVAVTSHTPEQGEMLKTKLVRELNSLFKRRAILKINQKVALTPLAEEAEWLWERNKALIQLLETAEANDEIGGDVLIRLNRRLLYAAFSKEIRPKDSGYFERTFGAHSIAMRAVSDALKEAQYAFSACQQEDPDIPSLLGDLQERFNQISRRVHHVLNPAKRYIQDVLNRELALANNVAKIDHGELVFAAAAFGAINDWKPNEQLSEARRILATALPDNGRFQTRRPFHATNKGYRLFPIGYEMTRSFAQLLQKGREEDLDPKLVRKLLNIFEERPVFDRKGEKILGWNFNNAPDPETASIWVTSIAVLALDRIVRMLNERINSMVLKHYNVEWPATAGSKLELNNLIYPDYELRLKHRGDGLSSEFHRLDNVSVAIRLQQMRAHLTRAMLPKVYTETYSALFYGPPGTGKTALAEALAVTSKTPLVRLSPSDLMVQGTDVIESRARAIFDSLSMLTQVVIVLDEFEPVVRNRERNLNHNRRSTDKSSNVEFQNRNSERDNDPAEFRFLVTGMLPKLRKLNKAAKAQSFVYCLATNHLKEIDEAAKRAERFDLLIPIYNPDPVSRAGVFLYRLIRFLQQQKNARWQKLEEVNGFAENLRKVVTSTRGVSANNLATDFFNINAQKPGTTSSIFHAFLDGDLNKSVIPRSQTSGSRKGTDVETEIESKLQTFESSWNK
jgi:DNA polymerase III delta prime subunit